MNKFPYGINKQMDDNAAKHGFPHWSCVSPKHNSWWVRKDGESLTARFRGKNGYLDDLAKFDAELPMKED